MHCSARNAFKTERFCNMEAGFPCPFSDAPPPPLRPPPPVCTPVLPGSGNESLLSADSPSDLSPDCSTVAPMPAFHRPRFSVMVAPTAPQSGLRSGMASCAVPAWMADSAATVPAQQLSSVGSGGPPTAHSTVSTKPAAVSLSDRRSFDAGHPSIWASQSDQCSPSSLPPTVGTTEDASSLVNAFKQALHARRSSPKNKDHNRSYTKLFVGQVPPWPNAKEWLVDLFEPYGVREIVLRTVGDRVNAFVWCQSRRAAEAAAAALNGHKYQNKRVWYTLCVEPSHSGSH